MTAALRSVEAHRDAAGALDGVDARSPLATRAGRSATSAGPSQPIGAAASRGQPANRAAPLRISRSRARVIAT